ncbi:MAG: hypothetical protein OXB88_01900, partial [Bacteriovoracales bacterium]|nr:hypothetical protein [Bacteriovoracales bacterium]
PLNIHFFKICSLLFYAASFLKKVETINHDGFVVGEDIDKVGATALLVSPTCQSSQLPLQK